MSVVIAVDRKQAAPEQGDLIRLDGAAQPWKVENVMMVAALVDQSQGNATITEGISHLRLLAVRSLRTA